MYQNLNAPTIQTDRLFIRFVDKKDVYEYYKICSNPSVCRYLTFNPYKSIKETSIVIDNMIRAYLQGSDVNLSIILKEENLVIGSISLSFKQYDNSAEVGYILNEVYWNKGYMNEALNALIIVCKEYYNLDYLTANYLQDNISSEKLLLKNGFNIDEIINNGFIKNNQFYNLVKTSLILK